jgi:hypothetical protein
MMAFLFETPLAALAAAAGAASLPIIIHLLNRRRFRIVTWAAMRFLLAAQRKNTRKMRLEQLLLLILRTAVVLLLVLAMASVMPWAERLWHRLFPDSAAFAATSGKRMHKILVLDGSFSMGLKAGDATCFDRARAAAAQVVAESPSGDGFSVVLMAAPPRRIVPEPSHDARKLTEEIQALRLPHGNADLAATLNAIEDMLRQSPGKFDEREVYFFTDLQRSTWTARQNVDPSATLQKIQGRARTVFVDVGHETATNTAITSLILNNPLATSGTLTPVTATLHNYGAEPRKQVRVELLVGKARATAHEPPLGLRVAEQRLIDLPPGQFPLTFEHRFRTPGEYVVQVRLENDALEVDDVRTVLLTVKETVPVLLVNGKPGREPYDGATDWLYDALNPYQGGLVPRSVPARSKVISEVQFADAGLGDLTACDCVFLCDVKQLGSLEVRRLETHLRRGGGVVFCLGPRVNLEAYNRLLYRNGEGLLPARLLSLQQAPENHSFSLHADNYDEPPLDAFKKEQDRLSLRSAHFRQYVRTEPAPRGRSRKVLTFRPERTSNALDPKPSAGLPIGEAALIEGARYRGRVVLLTSTANMDWTTWPISPSFPALMQELLHFAIAGRLREQAAVVGDVLEEFLPTGGAGLQVALQTPDGRTEALQTEARDENSVLRWADTDVSGLYRALIGQHPQEYLFAVNVPTTTESQQACESEPARTNLAELQRAYPGWEFQLVTDPNDVVHSGGLATESAERPLRGMGTVLARGLLLLVLVLLLAEVVLAWRFGHHSAVGASDVTPAPGRLVPVTVAVLAGTAGVLLAFVLAHAAATGDFLSFLPEGVRSSIEARLGIPPPAAGEGARWHLEFMPYLGDADTNRWLAGTFALAAIALVVGIYRREGETAGMPYKLLLAGLRIFLILLTLTVLLPQVRLWFERQGWPDLVILIDDSRSMSTTDRYRDPEVSEAAGRIAKEAGLTAPQRLQLAQALLTRSQPDWLDDLLTRRKVKVHVYHCSSRAARLGDLTEPEQHEAAVRAVQGLSAAGESSQLGTALRQVLNDFRGSSLAAVIMLTDGVTTEGEDLVKVSRYAAQMGVPLFYVGIGDAHPVRDLKLHDLQVEDAVYVNDRVVFEGFVTGQGYTDRTVPVVLREKGKDKVLVSQMVTLDAEGKPVKFRLTHQPTEPGEKVFVLEVPEQDDEIRPADNNRLERSVYVREAKVIKVLYVEGTARYDFRFIKHLLERESDRDKRNKTLDLNVLLLDADPEYPAEDKSALADFPTKEELNAYDVVIFGDVDPKDKRVEKNLQHLADFVRERGGGFLMIAGERYSPHAYKDSALRDVLPIEVTVPPPEADRPEGFRPELTPAGRFHSIFRFSPDEAENMTVWNQLAPLHWWAEGYRLKPAAEVLLVHPERMALESRRAAGPGKERHPLAVQQFVGAGRSMFFGFNESWRWRHREKELRFNQFWIQAVRYLARSRSGRIKLYLDRQTPYRRGEPMKVTVRFPDDAPPPAPDTKVEVVKERTPPQAPPGAEVDRETVPLLKVEGSRATYEGLLTRTPEGDYRFWLKAPVVADPKPRGEARVLPPPGELDLLRMNQPDLERSAEETHGRFYTLAEADRLLDELPAGRRVALNTPQPPTLLWNHFAVFALALGLLGAEWVLRKRKHLL